MNILDPDPKYRRFKWIGSVWSGDEVEPTMSITEKPDPIPAPSEVDPETNSELTHDEWGNGMVYISESDNTGRWIGYDPDTVADLDEYR